MNLLYLDFETRSEADLRSVGAYVYAAHPSTEVICAATATGKDEAVLWVGEAVDLLIPRLEDCTIVAHNAEFEREILRNVFGVALSLSRFIDTAALAARMSLPRKLENLAAFFNLDAAAKEAGKAAITSLCKPRKPTKTNPDRWWTPQTKPEVFDKLYARCVQDVDLTRAIFHKLLPLEEQERAIWQLTLKMNERGVKVDLASIPIAQEVIRREAEPLTVEFERMVGCKAKSPIKVARALGLNDMQKSTVRKALRDPQTEPAAKKALEIHRALSKSSVAKLEAMKARTMEDARVRGSFIYCGAERTARWSSNGVQFQNFARGLGAETLVAFDAMHAGCLEPIFVGAKREPPEPPLTPMSTISNILRGFIVGPFYVGDMAQIEARGIAWLAEDEDQLTLFRNKRDPYCAMASDIYGFEVTKKEKDKRFMGKQAELGCGYGLGFKGFIRMLDEIYDVQITEEFSKQVVNAYRKKHPKIVALWDRLGKGFAHVVAKNADRVRVTRNIWMGTVMVGGILYAFMELPSGRRLYYADPTLESTAKGINVRYFGREQGIWTYVRTYGGKLAENATQAISRDILGLSMLRLNGANYDLVMTVHDEVVAEDPYPTTEKLKEFKRIMEITPEWAAGLPVEVDAFMTPRYRK